MSEQNPTQMPVLVPVCPVCGEPLEGLNIATMKLPAGVAGGGKPEKFITFLLAYCPNQECSSALSVQYVGEEQAESSAAAAGLWTPPGAGN